MDRPWKFSIILDEAQINYHAGKMFLTRLGFNSKMIVNGNISQIDLPRNTVSLIDTQEENSRISIRLTLFVFSQRWFAIGIAQIIEHRPAPVKEERNPRRKNSKKEQFELLFFYLIDFLGGFIRWSMFYRTLRLLEDR